MTLARLVASGGGGGYVPVAAGTLASALAVLLGALLMLLPPYALPVAALIATHNLELARRLDRIVALEDGILKPRPE